ncbi:Uncharacterized protein HZ326_22116 [Fusarium oxysporum f. sp. albedinis]|nr:Uncharacterized protein HZ326_22116 [Fusarium oxysporum f. sp. albedinis]
MCKWRVRPERTNSCQTLRVFGPLMQIRVFILYCVQILPLESSTISRSFKGPETLDGLQNVWDLYFASRNNPLLVRVGGTPTLGWGSLRQTQQRQGRIHRQDVPQGLEATEVYQARLPGSHQSLQSPDVYSKTAEENQIQGVPDFDQDMSKWRGSDDLLAGTEWTPSIAEGDAFSISDDAGTSPRLKNWPTATTQLIAQRRRKQLRPHIIVFQRPFCTYVKREMQISQIP